MELIRKANWHIMRKIENYANPGVVSFAAHETLIPCLKKEMAKEGFSLELADHTPISHKKLVTFVRY